MNGENVQGGELAHVGERGVRQNVDFVVAQVAEKKTIVSSKYHTKSPRCFFLSNF